MYRLERAVSKRRSSSLASGLASNDPAASSPASSSQEERERRLIRSIEDKYPTAEAGNKKKGGMLRGKIWETS